MADPNPQEGQLYGDHDASAATVDGGDERTDGAIASGAPRENDNQQIAEAGDGAMQLMGSNSNQLTLLFQGEVYVFESVTPEKVLTFSP